MSSDSEHSADPSQVLAAARQPRSALRRRRPRLGHRRLLFAAGTLGIILVLLVAGVAGYGFYLNSKIGRVAVRHLTPGPAAGGEKGTENILLVGSTSRCALKVQNPAYGLCSQGVTGVNSDVVMILHLNAATHAVSILSIPRDTFVPNARTEGANKIDAALAEGPTQLVDAIEQDFGIPIQHYIALNFDTFSGVVNAVGGVRMFFPEPVYDASSGLNVTAPGCRALNGTQALQVVRARHLQYKDASVSSTDPKSWPQETQSDLARIRRDHEFLRVLASAVARQGLGNPLRDQQLVAAVAPQLQVDSGLSASHLVDLVLTYHSININGAPQLTLPIVATTFGSYHYKGGDYGEIVWPSQAQDQQTIDTFLGIDANVGTMTGLPLPARAAVTVAVLNGTGRINEATTTGKALSALGFAVVHMGDTPPVGAESETVVYYATPQQQAAAQAVLHSLTGYAVLGMNPAMVTPGADVTIVTGTHFAVLPPAAAAAPGPAPVTSTPPPHPHADQREHRYCSAGRRPRAGQPVRRGAGAVGSPLLHANRSARSITDAGHSFTQTKILTGSELPSQGPVKIVGQAARHESSPRSAPTDECHAARHIA